MNKLHQVYYIGLSDFIDRIRNKSSILLILFMMYITYLFFPQNGATIYYSLNFHRDGYFYRGIYNSSWLGWVSAIAFISVITLIGFYLVNNSIKRERDLSIGEITASLPINSLIYILGKAFGNFLFLILQMLIVIVITTLMQLVRGESYSIEIFKLLLPFLVLVVPVCFIIAVLAIVFENIPFLSNTFGNVVYFFIWSGLISISLASKGNDFITDIFGLKYASNMLETQVKINFKELQNLNGFNIGNSGEAYTNIKTFVMAKVNITTNFLFQRIFWCLIAIFLLFMISLIFKSNSLIVKKTNKTIKSPVQNATQEFKAKPITLTPLLDTKAYGNPLSIIKSEFQILLNTPSMRWYSVLAVLSISMLFNTGEMQNKLIVPLLWIIPIFIWSKFASLQKNYDMEVYLLTYTNYRNFQLINSFIASFLFTLLINTGILIKFILVNNINGIVSICIGSLFVNSLAMLIGNLSGNSTIFEVIYIIIWYVGILNGATYLDFLSISPSNSGIHISNSFLIISVLLLITSYIIKKSIIQMKYCNQ